jgi:hypothetical protein
LPAAQVQSQAQAAPAIIIPNVNTSTTPVRITDAASDQILAASLTLNSLILTDSTGKVTTNLLPASGITFEASHLDAVQEPLFSPAIPEDTYVSVTLIYSNAQVAYVDSSTHTVDLVTATLANTSQTITFPRPSPSATQQPLCWWTFWSRIR